MEQGYPDQYAFEPLTPARCKLCGKTDVFPSQVETLLDKIAWAAFRGPFLCRACHRKFYWRVRRLVVRPPSLE